MEERQIIQHLLTALNESMQYAIDTVDCLEDVTDDDWYVNAKETAKAAQEFLDGSA